MLNSRNIILSICTWMLIVLAPVTTQAQVDFDVSTGGRGLVSDIVFQYLNDDERTVAEFLYLTAKDEFCTSDLVTGYSTEHIVCVFDDPTQPGTKHLYVITGYSDFIVVLYERKIAAVMPRGAGLSALPDGDYDVLLFPSYGKHVALATVSFSIGEAAADTAASELEIAESITLETPAPGTTWQEAEKHRMTSGCHVAYGMVDFDTAAIAVVLKGEITIREVAATAFYGNDKTPIRPAQVEEEGFWRDWFASISVYSDPQHLQDYKLHYEHDEKTYEVNFRYEGECLI